MQISWSPAASKAAQQLLSVATIGALAAAFLGGKYSFSRFFDETITSVWLELRLWFSIAALAGLWLQQTMGGAPPFRPSAQLKWLLAGVVIFSAAFFFHVLVFATPEVELYYLADAFYLALHAVLFAHTFRTREHVLIFIYVVEAIAIVFVVLVLYGFRNVVIDGLGWAPFGSPITFYRLQFLACCGALYALAISNRPSVRLLHLLIGAIALFATYSSLARAALLSSVLTAVYMVMIFIVVGRPKTAALVGGFFVAVTAVFFAQSSELAGRLSEFRVSSFSPGSAHAMQSAPSAAVTPETSAGNMQQITTERMVAESQPSRSHETPLLEKKRSDLDDEDEYLMRSNRLMLKDDTYRIRLFLQAWKLFQEHKLLGAGFGTYEVQARNYAGDALVTYRHPHNVILEVLYATGAAGGALFCFALAAGLVVLHQAIRIDANWAFLAAYALSVLLSSMGMGDIYDFRGFFFIAIMIACVGWTRDIRT